MNSIGGYFELELQRGEEYHKNAIRLNTGRNALELILKIRKYKKVYIPYYTCDVILEPFNKLKINYEFYSIDEYFEPLFKYNLLNKDEGFLYTNYFGLKDSFIAKLSVNCKNLIIDNSQAFYSRPVSHIDTFYSPRKFFGLPDGAYLYTNTKFNIEFDKDNSLDRFGHLLGRIEKSAEESYALFLNNERSLIGQPIKFMSSLTKNLLKGIDYETTAKARIDNFSFLHKTLGSFNVIKINFNNYFVPMGYPFLFEKEDLRSYLIQNKIYVAQYWPNVLERCGEGSLEKKIATRLLSLPIDQRYSEHHMQKIADLILKYV